MSVQAVINIAATDPVAVPATSGPDPAAGTSEWFKRAGYYAAQAVANAERAHRRTIERRLATPSARWTGRAVVRTYRANAEGDRRFRDEAEVFTSHGYRPWIESHSPNNLYGGLVLLAASTRASPNESDKRRRGNQRVSWVKDASLAGGRLESAPPNRQGAERKRKAMPTWRKATWSLVAWSLLILAWLAAARAPGIAITGVIGFGLLGIVWLMSRSRFTTLVYGPQGQQRTVTARAAKRRVEMRGWSYTPSAPDPPSGQGVS
jgi:hypothetical protein